MQVTWMASWLVLLSGAVGCQGQYSTGGIYGMSPFQGPVLPGLQQAGYYPGQTFTRPAIQSTYGYGYSNTHLKSASTSEEAVENGLKAAMEPLNNVMSSPPAETSPLVARNMPNLLLGRDAGSAIPTGTNMQGLFQGRDSAATTSTANKSDPTVVRTDGQEHASKALPAASAGGQCCCPCSAAASYLGWPYGGYPFYDLGRFSPSAASAQDYPYSYPYVYFNPGKTSPTQQVPTSSSKAAAATTARTFTGWLPWLRPTAQSAYYQAPGQSYNRMYYTGRYY